MASKKKIRISKLNSKKLFISCQERPAFHYQIYIKCISNFLLKWQINRGQRSAVTQDVFRGHEAKERAVNN